MVKNHDLSAAWPSGMGTLARKEQPHTIDHNSCCDLCLTESCRL